MSVCHFFVCWYVCVRVCADPPNLGFAELWCSASLGLLLNILLHENPELYSYCWFVTINHTLHVSKPRLSTQLEYKTHTHRNKISWQYLMQINICKLETLKCNFHETFCVYNSAIETYTQTEITPKASFTMCDYYKDYYLSHCVKIIWINVLLNPLIYWELKCACQNQVLSTSS